MESMAAIYIGDSCLDAVCSALRSDLFERSQSTAEHSFSGLQAALSLPDPGTQSSIRDTQAPVFCL